MRALFAALVAVCLAVPAAGQSIEFRPVLEDDAVVVMQSRWPAGTARRSIPARPPQQPFWPRARAADLLAFVEGIAAEGLDPADYRAGELRAAIEAGPGMQLNQVAAEIFVMVAQDLRDGRTPVSARRAYLMEDPDRDRLPLTLLMQRALATADVAGMLESLNPNHPDFLALRHALSEAPAEDVELRAAIRVNMDRWRWLPRDLGGQYLIVNVPEYRLRLMVNGFVVNSYRTIVGTPGRNATPQLSEMVEGVIFNPTWTVPQSIVVGEGLGNRVLNNPQWARSRGYTATRGANGYVSVVQAPGPGNALGLMKLDMPNRHAIFLHDTPSRQLFEREERALSHGCIRTENAVELALTLTAIGNAMPAQEALRVSESGEYTRVPLQQQVPVYIAYFTMGRDLAGNLVSFSDIYGRDAAVRASFAAPRVARQDMVASH